MMKRTGTIGAVLLIAAGFAAGCNDRPSQDGSAGAQRTRQEPKPRFETMLIPAGTDFVALLETRLSTDTNRSGEPFVATTSAPIVVGGKTVVPAGARVRGRLRDVQASGRVKGRARMTLAFDEIVDSAGKVHTLSARPLTLQAASTTHGDVEKIAAGGVLGAVIGAIAGGGKGAAVGAGAGAGAGAILMLATQGDEVELNPGQKLNVHMTASTSIPVVAQR